MAWFVVHRTETGQIVSSGDVVASPLPEGLTSVDVGARPADSKMWDPASRAFVDRPAKVLVDRIQELRDDPALSAVWTRLTANQQTALRNRLIAMLGPNRYRNQSERTDLA